MNPRLRLVLLSPAFRWGVVLLVLVIAGAIAFWPRQPEPTAAVPAKSQQGTTQQGTTQQRTAAEPSDGSGPPCPEAVGGAGAPRLGGARVSCLTGGATVDAAAVLAARPGRPTLVNVWASWCPPCQEELPVLNQYAKQPGAARVVGVQIDSAAADGRVLLDRLHVRLPTLYDGDESLSKALKVPYALPASYLVDADGGVRFISSPRVFTSVRQVAGAIARYGGRGDG
ncbi:MAG: TlpA family protein disulfide reductase [Sciscionella sp.]